jgi:hypothetical protein
MGSEVVSRPSEISLSGRARLGYPTSCERTRRKRESKSSFLAVEIAAWVMSQDLWSFRASFSHHFDETKTFDAGISTSDFRFSVRCRHHRSKEVKKEAFVTTTEYSVVCLEYSSSYPFVLEGVELETGTMTIVHRITFHSRVGKGERLSSDPTPPSVAWATSPNVLACSAAIEPHRFILDERPLCSDRKGPFDHLQYRGLVKSVSALYLFDRG